MEVIAAIDLLEGKVVRLKRGKRESATVYSQEPLDTAMAFIEQGVRWLHLVDLDAAFGISRNRRAVEQITLAAAAKGVKVEVGGGIRTVKNAQALFDCKVARAIVGTKALDEARLTQLTRAFGNKVWAAC